MTDSQQCEIRCIDGGTCTLSLEPGRSLVIIGANCSGKTRLGAHIESQLPSEKVQRIAAQKSLQLNDRLNIISYERAIHSLRIGYPEVGQGNKQNHRWGSKPATHPLSDFDALQQSLFAEHNSAAWKFHADSATDPNVSRPTTKLEKLKAIWDELLPHRALVLEDASIKASTRDGLAQALYAGSEMSDGERVIFYFLGQSLLARFSPLRWRRQPI